MLTVVTAIVVVVATRTGGASPYRFAALFDDARGMVAGQEVKIAGAKVGTVQAVDLAPGPKARIVMSIDRRFVPLHADATCSIQPEGLISENFVECDPGNSAARLPSAGPGGLPTVPLDHTTVPFSLQDVLNVFSAPTDQRLALLISELGIGTAGRGQDLNELLRRADPALQSAQRTLRIVNGQREQLATAVVQTDDVLSQLAGRNRQVTEFVSSAATVARAAAQHRSSLGQSINRLPAMLAAVRPGLSALNRAAANASPLLDELHAAAPALSQLTYSLPAFTKAGLPALHTLASAAHIGIPAVYDARPVIAKLLKASGPLRMLASQLYGLLASSRSSGAFEGLLRVAYAFATNTALYDNVSHILTFIVSIAPQCILGQEAGTYVSGCDHNYSGPGTGTIPVNEPSCGAVSAAWWNDTCPSAPPGPIVFSARRRSVKVADVQELENTALSGKTAPAHEFQSLLGYLLK
jgi:ABC-type transporter Mla subunit MlaD